MNPISLCLPEHGRPVRRSRGRRAAVMLLSAMLLVPVARVAAGSPSSPRGVALVLPGASLDDLTRADLPHLAELVHDSAGAWVAAWRAPGPPSGSALRFSLPLRRELRRRSLSAADEAGFLRQAKHGLPTTEFLWLEFAGSPDASTGPDRGAMLRAADKWVGQLIDEMSRRDVLILAPPQHSGPGLVPLFWWRHGGAAGLLYSGSTHMSGVVTGDDVAATVAGLVGAPYAGGGNRLTVVSSHAGSLRRGDTLAALRRLGELAGETDRVRAVANRVVQGLLLLLMVSGAAALRMGRRLPRPVALAPLLLPALLLIDGARRGGDGGTAALLAALVAAGAIAARRSWRGPAMATLAACAVAILAGSVFRWAILGYSIRLGVRFYGIGNEYMGWCVGAALLAVGLPKDGRVRPGAVGLLLAVVLLLGHPSLGGKVGGAITALAAVAVEAWPWLRTRRGHAAAALAVAIAGLVGLAAWDSARPPALQTHLGRLALRVAAHGPRPFFTLAAGKLQTELRVTQSLWGVMLAAGIWLVMEARRAAPQAEATRAVSRLLPVAFIALLSNDSGVTAAALMLSYGTLTAGEFGEGITSGSHSSL